MRYFFLMLALVSSSCFADSSYVNLSADKTSYAVGNTASILMRYLTNPENKDLEFVTTATFDGAALTVTALSNGEAYATTPALTSGTHTVVAAVYLQDKSLAASLNAAINYYMQDIVSVNASIANTTDPTRLASLNSELALDEDRLSATESELSSIRTPLDGSATLQIQAQ
jgi:hypothetical protein